MVSKTNKPKDKPDREPVWTYRGYRLKEGEFVTAMVHFFRGEVQRANVWRQRLDTTTNWAVLTTGAVLSFAFAEPASSHLVILVNMILVTLFLIVEARRYRYYELWSYRVRLMETDFFVPMLVPPFHPSPEWSEAMAESLLHPRFPISELEAIGRRLRRNYLWIYSVVGLCWLAKLGLFPEPVGSWNEMVARAAVGSISGELVLGIVAAFYVAVILLSVLTIGLRQAAGEVLPRYGVPEGDLRSVEAVLSDKTAWFRPVRRRQQILTLIITEKSEKVSQSIMQELKRGVTVVAGKGAYSKQPYAVLMCALTVTEIPSLKSLVAKVDSQAFVVVIPARGIFGKGFVPLKESP